MTDPGTESHQVNVTMDQRILDALKRRYPAARSDQERIRYAVQDSIDQLPEAALQDLLQNEE